ncbi:MAG TPA: YbaB/EbfC family nucleoid-associated protein [Planctomycetaceae bacterium]|nr:YbaB/EbfC family nucleoid-associated protein [Planctomycetaceae bacterium]HRF00596.1 YbaB/EbfC family nucleoid-associated protein [Pirellulaceae bacterium]
MFKGLGQMASMLRQAREIGGKLEEMNRRMATWRLVGAAGGGMIEVEIDGLGQVRHVRIDPTLFAKGDREMIEALLPAAFNDASMKLKERQLAEMGELSQGADLGALGKLLQEGDGA